MIKNSKNNLQETCQEVCIDLPGETVQCWRSSEKVKIILRKHRDIIFDIKLGVGKTYTVQATDSDFYNQRDKKLVYVLRKNVINFNDGERLHVWVTRSFKGALLLKCQGQLIMKVEPNKMDKHQYDNDPKTKPQPIIVSFGSLKSENSFSAARSAGKKLQTAPTDMKLPAAASIGEDCAIVCVIDGTIKGMPINIANFFKEGGGKTGLVDIDPFEVATRN